MKMSAMSPFFELSAFVGKIFVGDLWQGTAFIGAVSCCLRFLRRMQPSSRFTLCGLAFILVLLMPLLDASGFKPGSPYGSPHVFRFSFCFGWALTVTWLLLSLWRSIQLLKQGRALVGLWRRAVPLDLASDCLESAGQYARCLIRLTAFREARRRFQLALHAWERRSELAYRIHALLPPVRRISSQEARVTAALLSLSLLGMCVAFRRVPSLVSVEGLAISEPPKIAAVTIPDGRFDPPLLTHASFVPRQHPELLRASLPGRSARRHSYVRLVTASEPVNFGLANGVTASRKHRLHLEFAAAKRGVLDDTAHEAKDSATPAEVFLQLIYTPTYAAMPLRSGWLIIPL
jgi:hypothetical protein